MKKQIQLNKKEIEYTFKPSKRAKKMRLTIYCDGNFVVTAPENINESLVKQFIIKKSQWIISKIEYFKNLPKRIFLENNKENYVINKDRALVLAQQKTNYFNSIYNFKFNKIKIKNQKSRWGSCSRKRNLNFNYKISLIPEKICDYIIVHEICHLKEFNHSKSFWNLVAKTIPNHAELRKELKMFY